MRSRIHAVVLPSEVGDFADEVHQVFLELGRTLGAEGLTAECSPAIDIYETDDGLLLRADLPGVSLDTLELQVQDNKLTLFGRMESCVPENARLLHQEFETGDFLRSFILSDEVDHERISAKLRFARRARHARGRRAAGEASENRGPPRPRRADSNRRAAIKLSRTLGGMRRRQRDTQKDIAHPLHRRHRRPSRA